MTINLSAAVRNAMADALESTIGTAPILRIYSGAKPTATSDAATGTLLAEMTLPSDWLAAASAGAKTLLGTWEDASANASGTAGYFRILDSTGTTTGLQGTVTATGGGGDLELSTTSIVSGQPVTITAFTYTRGNA